MHRLPEQPTPQFSPEQKSVYLSKEEEEEIDEKRGLKT